MALIARNPRRMNANFAILVYEDIKKYVFGDRWQRDSFINSPHVLTRIIYFALGLRDQMPRAQEIQFLMEQVELIHDIDEVEEEKRKAREKTQRNCSPCQEK